MHKLKDVNGVLLIFLLIFSPLATTKGMFLSDCDTIYTADFYKIQPTSSAFYREKIIKSLNIDTPPIDTSLSFIVCPNQSKQFSNQEIMRLFDLGRAYFENSELDRAKLIFEQLLMQDSIHEYSSLYARIHNFLGLINDISGDKLNAYFHFQTLAHEEEKNSPEINATAYLNLGAIYTFFKDYEEAESLYKKGLAISRDSFLEYGWLLHRLGELKNDIGDYQESEHYLMMAQKHWLKLNDSRSNCYTEIILGEVYSKTKSNAEAIPFLEDILKKEKDNSVCRILLLLKLGDKCIEEHRYQAALNYFRETTIIAKQKELKPFKIIAYKQMVTVYLQQQKIKEASKTFDIYTKLNDDYYIKDYKQTAQSFQRIKDQLEREKILKLSQRKETQITKQLYWHIIMNRLGLLLLCASCFFGGGIFYAYIKQKKSKDLLATLNTKLTQKQEDLEKANEEISSHKQELELQLVKKAMMIGKYDETLNQVEGLVKTDSFHSQKDKLLHILKQSQNDESAKDLNLQITKANQDFFQKLSAQYPSLSQNDLRLCALLKMNLNTKEIASITFKSAQSIKVARSRLRKKLGLTHNKMALSVFLNQV